MYHKASVLVKAVTHDVLESCSLVSTHQGRMIAKGCRTLSGYSQPRIGPGVACSTLPQIAYCSKLEYAVQSVEIV